MVEMSINLKFWKLGKRENKTKSEFVCGHMVINDILIIAFQRSTNAELPGQTGKIELDREIDHYYLMAFGCYVLVLQMM